MRCPQLCATAFCLGLLLPLALRAEEVRSEPCAADSLSCDEACVLSDWCDAGNCGRRVFGFLPSDHCFDRFVSPISNPFLFEDPRSLTEARGLFLDNSLPPVAGSGDVQVWAGQLRGRLTDRWSVIAQRFGHLQVNDASGGGPGGYLSTPIGLKYNFWRDVDRQLLVSGGVTYFIPGSEAAISNLGSGDFHFFLTGGKQIFGRGHWLSATGLRVPADTNWGTQMAYWSNQWDYEVVDHWYALSGVNWYHFTRDAGYNIGSSVTGLDLISLPQKGVAGTNIATGLVGVKWKPSGHLEVGSAFEFHLTDRTDILRNRLFVDVIFRY